MPLRQIEFILPQTKLETVLAELEENKDNEVRYSIRLENGMASIKTIMDTESLEAVTDNLEQFFTNHEEARIIIYPVEAVIPRLIDEKKQEEKENDVGDIKPGHQRIHREELYSDIYDQAKLTKNYIILIILSAIVAAIGLIKNSEAILIGAMVIAPMLGPNVALAMATTLGDPALFRKSSITAVAGIIVVFIVSLLIGFFITVDLSSHSVVMRSAVSLSDIALALAAGVAGILSFTMGASTSVVGVMVAIALIPPLVASGLLLGNGQEMSSFGAFGLFTANVICLNLAGVLTFLYQGVRPTSWWEEKEAKKATVHSLVIWTTLLLLLIAVIVFFGKFD